MSDYDDRAYESYLAGLVEYQAQGGEYSRDNIYQIYASYRSDGMSKDKAFWETMLYFQADKIDLSTEFLDQIILDNEPI